MSNSQHLPVGKSGTKIEGLFVLARQKKASDIYLAAGDHPVLKVYGKLERLTEYPVIKGSYLEDLFYSVLTAKQQQDFERRMELELTYITEAAGNIQIILYATENGIGAACRLIPTKIPSFREIGPGDSLKKIASLDQGLILITGKSNSGKTTTIASIIDYINTHLRKSIVTIENPIRFAHKSKSSLVLQREIGLHAQDYASSILTAMRSDMDVIFFSDIDGPETLAMAMNAAESHLVLTTSISFGGSGWAIRKLFDLFPNDRQEYVRMHLSRVLRALIWQHLIPLEGHKGLKIAMEIMLNNKKIAEFIQKNELHKVHGEIEKGSGGMQTIRKSISEIEGVAIKIATHIGESLLFGI
ncbi:MAG: Flp pilus assembly complex ATPase component TadA [Desulfobacterales bacterium]|nr:Flp pilus assembly complex ATPase component TadA [Desulfobacterales bacterium]MBL7205129.1 Flp pilus assembly complex ATPase component TadA [Desulfobacteraceae bacterium]